MKRFLVLVSIFICSIAHADTETINWYVDGTSYATTTCQTGGDIILPTSPYKYGYTFLGWEGYTPIEYLESTGTQYIDTGYPSDDIYGIEAVFQPTKNSTWGSIFSGVLDDCTIGYSNAQINVLYLRYTGLEISAGIPIKANIFNTINISNGKLTVNGTLFTSFSRRNCGSSSVDFFIFNNSGKSRPTNIKLKNLKLFNYSNTLVRDFIPVLDNNGIPCMYDKVSGQFFYNQGTGIFIAGPVIN